MLAERLFVLLSGAGVYFDPKDPVVIDDIPVKGYNARTGFMLECGKCQPMGLFTVRRDGRGV